MSVNYKLFLKVRKNSKQKSDIIMKTKEIDTQQNEVLEYDQNNEQPNSNFYSNNN